MGLFAGLDPPKTPALPGFLRCGVRKTRNLATGHALGFRYRLRLKWSLRYSSGCGGRGSEWGWV